MDTPQPDKNTPPTPESAQGTGDSSCCAQKPVIDIALFTQLDLRVGTILSAEPHPGADRLMVLKVDIGEAEVRQIIAGIRETYDAVTLIHKQVVVVSNLKPAKLRGLESQGMLLAASDELGLSIIAPIDFRKPGSVVK